MADYTTFPFDDYTIDEIGQMFIGSVQAGDKEFAAACLDQIKSRKPEVLKETIIRCKR